jgi:hypothetical protein
VASAQAKAKHNWIVAALGQLGLGSHQQYRLYEDDPSLDGPLPTGLMRLPSKLRRIQPDLNSQVKQAKGSDVSDLSRRPTCAAPAGPVRVIATARCPCR